MNKSLVASLSEIKDPEEALAKAKGLIVSLEFQLIEVTNTNHTLVSSLQKQEKEVKDLTKHTEEWRRKSLSLIDTLIETCKTWERIYYEQNPLLKAEEAYRAKPWWAKIFRL